MEGEHHSSQEGRLGARHTGNAQIELESASSRRQAQRAAGGRVMLEHENVGITEIASARASAPGDTSEGMDDATLESEMAQAQRHPSQPQELEKRSDVVKLSANTRTTTPSWVPAAMQRIPTPCTLA